MGSDPMTSKPILCVDFDGVLHSYSSGWRGSAVISDPPVPGAMVWLKSCLFHFDVCVFSSRSRDEAGIEAMRDWILAHAAAELGAFAAIKVVRQLRFPDKKPAAFLTIDDRALTFTGEFRSPIEMLDFKPWNKP
jgi:hypothetical protein